MPDDGRALAERLTLQQRAKQIYGLDPNIVQRGMVLPYGKTVSGDTEWAIPQIGVDLMKSLLLPGHVLQGGSYTPEDAMNFTLDYALPATMRGLPQAKRAAKDVGAGAKKFAANVEGSVPRKAVERAGKTIDDLPMDEASRMARAKEMGFTTDALKGTNPYDWRTGKEITEFKSPGLGDVADAYPDYVGRQGGFAGFFTNDPATSNRFATALEGGANYPVKLRFKKPLVVDAKGRMAREFQFGKYAQGDTFGDYHEIKRVLEGKTNYDGIILKNTKDEGTVFIPRGSEQVRSRFAKFDPAKKDSADLLAGVGIPAAAASLLGIRMMEDDNL